MQHVRLKSSDILGLFLIAQVVLGRDLVSSSVFCHLSGLCRAATEAETVSNLLPDVDAPAHRLRRLS